jgi:predicted CXXCH cytochrome family protein
MLGRFVFYSSLSFACISGGILGVRAEDQVEHPFIDTKDIKTETCLKCHPEKNTGKYVHTAISSGCDSCHLVESANNKTKITPTATGGDLCAMCHEAPKDPVVHGPVKAGECLVCHDPHTGDYPDQLRAATNKLCLSCHGANQPDVKVNLEIKTVALLGGQSVSLEEYRQAPKLGLDRSGTRNHPIMGHPVSGVKDPRKKGEMITCLSCHAPHSSELANLMPKGVKSSLDLCTACHQ